MTTITTKQGFLITFHEKDRSVGANLLRGEHEPHTCNVIASLLKPGMTALIAGSNYGVFDVLCARFVGASGHVWGFEPNPSLWKFWGLNVSQNGAGNICSLEKAALSDGTSPTMILHTDSDDSDLGGTTAFSGGSRDKAFEVPVVTIDRFTSQIDRIDLLKLDVEGWENRVLLGASETLSNRPPRWIITEYRQQDDCEAQQYIRRLMDMGHTLERLQTDTSAQSSIAPEELPATIHSELLFTRRIQLAQAY